VTSSRGAGQGGGKETNRVGRNELDRRWRET
jgi:hypothetical protein